MAACSGFEKRLPRRPIVRRGIVRSGDGAIDISSPGQLVRSLLRFPNLNRTNDLSNGRAVRSSLPGAGSVRAEAAEVMGWEHGLDSETSHDVEARRALDADAAAGAVDANVREHSARRLSLTGATGRAPDPDTERMIDSPFSFGPANGRGQSERVCRRDYLVCWVRGPMVRARDGARRRRESLRIRRILHATTLRLLRRIRSNRLSDGRICRLNSRRICLRDRVSFGKRKREQRERGKSNGKNQFSVWFFVSRTDLHKH